MTYQTHRITLKYTEMHWNTLRDTQKWGREGNKGRSRRGLGGKRAMWLCWALSESRSNAHMHTHNDIITEKWKCSDSLSSNEDVSSLFSDIDVDIDIDNRINTYIHTQYIYTHLHVHEYVLRIHIHTCVHVLVQTNCVQSFWTFTWLTSLTIPPDFVTALREHLLALSLALFLLLTLDYWRFWHHDV